MSSCIVLLVCLACIEAGLRYGLASSSTATLADPGRYFDPLCDEDYWRALRRGVYGESLHRVDSNDKDLLLGWIPDRSSLDAELALRSQSVVPDGQTNLALFGDSYVFGTTEQGERIHDYLQKRFPSARVRNFGVGGYGLDQTVLRIEERSSILGKGDVVIVGVLSTDIDRSILPVRDAPKPWFEQSQDGTLTLNLPAPEPAKTWFELNPVQATSLLQRRIQRTVSLWRAADSPSTAPACEVERKTRVAKALLARLGEFCSAQELNCYLLPLYRPVDIEFGPGWRQRVLNGDYGMPVIDVFERLQADPNGWRTLYGDDQHPNELGNQVIADWIGSHVGEDLH
jgi:lysophospholipase L1-like esterase